ncbi:MAG: 2,3-diketo-5-methylthiopentyl-1-phosphate enolase [Firmicutes bacterium]|nr:2,3-diketo-5-methylthiopentyl-1-phosphate enolase [Bacillota bacterium]
MQPDFIFATYRVQDREANLMKRAESIAIGLTVGSWTELPQARKDEVARHCGVVQGVEVYAAGDDGLVWADIRIGYPLANFTETMAALLTTVFGKLSMDGVIRLVRLDLPETYISRFAGPKYGVDGIRERLGVPERPLLMSIFKSCIGQSLDDLRAHFREQAQGGADLIKDDEIFFTEEYATPEQRVIAYHTEAERAYEQTGQLAHYAVNLTGPVTELRQQAKRLCDAGAEALLFNVYAYGLDALREVAADPAVTAPIIAHPAMAGALYAATHHGIAASIVLGQLLRLCGADVAIYPSPYGSVTLQREDGDALLQALREARGHLRISLPAPSAGIFPGLVPALVRDAGRDVIVNAGGGIHGHPGGATAGGQAFRAAIDSVMRGEPLAVAALTSEPLRQALVKWGEGQ